MIFRDWSLELLTRDGAPTVIIDRMGVMICGEGTLPGQTAPGENLGHVPLPPDPRNPGCVGATLPEVIALVGTLILQLARQAGHQGSELHRLQGLPDGFVRVLL